MKIHPLNDIVIIRRAQPGRVSAGGIYLAFDPDYREDIGDVVAAGPNASEVKAGDTVLFSTNGHQITHINSEEFVVLRRNSLIAILEGAARVESGTYLEDRQYAGRE